MRREMKLLAVVFLFCGSLIFTPSVQAQEPKPANPPSQTSTKSSAPAPKPVPPELTAGLQKVQALSGAIADLKQESGITALENELQKKVQDLFALATKYGFHYDQATGTFVANDTKPDAAKPEPKK